MTIAGTKSAPETTIKNLQAAYEGESNARAKYLEFAKKADADGYHQIASLFRATARAEEIHATNHARVIERLGAKPVAVIAEIHVGTTAENLKVALDGEVYERDVMYPEFIKEAEANEQVAALRTFKFAMEAEAGHAVLFTAAIKNLEQMKTKTAYYVCPVCGETCETPVEKDCPICHVPAEKFEVIE